MLETLVKYCSIESISGEEQNILNALAEDCTKIPNVYIMENCLSVGLLVRKGSLENKNIILLDAHVDQYCELHNIKPKIKENKIIATALDDRIGVTIILEILKNIDTSFTILASFTTKEEWDFIGAKHLVKKLKYKYNLFPLYCIVVDVTYSDINEFPYPDFKIAEIGFPKIGNGCCPVSQPYGIIEEQNLTNAFYYKHICRNVYNYGVPVLGVHEYISKASISDITDCYNKICEFISKFI